MTCHVGLINGHQIERGGGGARGERQRQMGGETKRERGEGETERLGEGDRKRERGRERETGKYNKSGDTA